MQECIGAQLENWDAQFQENWTSADLVDCILSFTATELVNKIVKAGQLTSQCAILPPGAVLVGLSLLFVEFQFDDKEMKTFQVMLC